MANTRTVKDSMGEMSIPESALYGAQTQRAIENFPISGLTMPRLFISSLAQIKASAAISNQQLGLLEAPIAEAIVTACEQVAEGQHDEHFPVDVFQTGSGTSSNMNANEVIAYLAGQQSGLDIHPNNHVNMGQSSNDVIPTAIHVSAAIGIGQSLMPALQHLESVIKSKQQELDRVVKTGRTHLMDAMPVTMGQELSGWAQQVQWVKERLDSSMPRLLQLAQGGTAVGTGINAHEDFAALFAKNLGDRTGIAFTKSPNFFASLSTQDTAVEISGQLKTFAVALMKIANDLRHMNSGPLAGLGEIALQALQPGSSIMPGKVNPVIPESVCMVAAQVIGNDATVAVAGQAGNFQLNVMLPVIAYNLLQSIELLSNAATALADKAIQGFTVNHDQLQRSLSLNPILVTALNSVIGYDKGAEIAKKSYQDKRPVLDVAAELTNLSVDELKSLLDPEALTKGGIQE